MEPGKENQAREYKDDVFSLLKSERTQFQNLGVGLQRYFAKMSMHYDSVSIFKNVPYLVNQMIGEGEQSAKEYVYPLL